jgi:hypothetical protein
MRFTTLRHCPAATAAAVGGDGGASNGPRGQATAAARAETAAATGDATCRHHRCPAPSAPAAAGRVHRARPRQRRQQRWLGGWKRPLALPPRAESQRAAHGGGGGDGLAGGDAGAGAWRRDRRRGQGATRCGGGGGCTGGHAAWGSVPPDQFPSKKRSRNQSRNTTGSRQSGG